MFRHVKIFRGGLDGKYLKYSIQANGLETVTYKPFRDKKINGGLNKVNGGYLDILAPMASTKNIYIRSMKINKQAIDLTAKSTIEDAMLQMAGVIEFDMMDESGNTQIDEGDNNNSNNNKNNNKNDKIDKAEKLNLDKDAKIAILENEIRKLKHSHGQKQNKIGDIK